MIMTMTELITCHNAHRVKISPLPHFGLCYHMENWSGVLINSWCMHEGYGSRFVCVAISVTMLAATCTYLIWKQGAVKLPMTFSSQVLCGFHWNALFRSSGDICSPAGSAFFSTSWQTFNGQNRLPFKMTSVPVSSSMPVQHCYSNTSCCCTTTRFQARLATVSAAHCMRVWSIEYYLVFNYSKGCLPLILTTCSNTFTVLHFVMTSTLIIW